MKRKSRWSSTIVRERISVHALAAVRTVRVKIIGESAESRGAAVSENKRSFAKTQSFLGAFPRFDAALPTLDSGVTCLSDASESPQQDEVPATARLDASVAQDQRALHKSGEQRTLSDVPRDDEASHSTTLRLRSVKRGRAGQLWQRQTPLVAFFVAVSLCVLSLLAVNWLAP
jgi:hypothetical protein